MADQKDENTQLRKLLERISKDTAEQRERVEICSERILVMEEQVGMMAHNEAYKKSFEVADELYQDSVPATNIAQQITEINEEDGRNKVKVDESGLQKNLNPASTTSSLDQADREAVLRE